MVAADDTLIKEERIELGCNMEPFMGHMLGFTDEHAVYRRTSDEMIIYYDKTANRCWVLNDSNELSGYLDDAGCRRVSQALQRLEDGRKEDRGNP
jgi:hypothetical protein